MSVNSVQALNLSTIGPVLLTAIQDEDIYLAGFLVLLLGALTVLGTRILDILLKMANPRIRFTGR
jgi:peptide/nickel transport system permease protein